MSTLVLGSEIDLRGRRVLVVRLIHAESIFQNGDQVDFVDEHYAELRHIDGTPEFISLSKDEKVFTEKKSTISALDPVWRPK